MVAAADVTAPEIDAAVTGFVAGDCHIRQTEEKAEEEADVDAPRSGKTKKDAGETGMAATEAPAASSSAALMASQFVAAPGKAKAAVLGALRLSYGDSELSFGRAEASDLFALLSAMREGMSTQGIIDTLWPGDDDRGGRLLESAVRQLNQVMRQASGLGVGVKFVVKVRQQRQLAAAYFDVDLWRFESAFVRTGTVEGRSARLAALQEMLALYRGPLLAGRDDLWVLPLRQAAQRQAVNAAERFAELARMEDPDRAVDVLRLAVERVDPYSEVLWCLLMSIQGEMGRLPAVRRTFELLKERMAEIDAAPSAQARQMYERLIR
ncbi:BTAD domain-containing putative transcriptional regulator [Nonomuraea sp. NPDC003560]|uniref:AfsR/SARP family transcriptional regulator n=1 Tax=Nonomuraea sp. NPDC003560 TaxID=3364341 RepID=UPI003686BD1C